MPCPSCGCENRESAKFCNECGTPLPLSCPSCGSQNRPGAKFCNECGVSLTAEVQSPRSKVQSREPKPSPTEDASPDGERRQLTVMFCDLVGSTALSEQLDPEELREVMRTYQEACVEVITRFDGHLAKYLGDGLLVYFGYPMAHEDDAQRAVRAGLGIVGAIHELPLQNTQLRKPLQVRIGIHTGLVVAGEMGSGDYREALAIVGETPNLAARIQGLAEPGTVVISVATQHLVQGFFACHDLGFHSVKGISTPVQVYQILGESGAQSRFEVAVYHRLDTPGGERGRTGSVAAALGESERGRRAGGVAERGGGDW